MLKVVSFYGHKDRIEAIVFSPDGRLLVSGSRDGTIRIWDVTTQQELQQLGDLGHLRSLSINQTGKLLAANSGKGALIWDLTTMQLVQKIEKHTNQVTCVGFSPDGRSLAIGSIDHTISVLDVDSWLEQNRFQVPDVQFENIHVAGTSTVKDVFLDSKGKILALLDSDGKNVPNPHSYNLPKFKFSSGAAQRTAPVVGISFNRVNNLLASASYRSVYLWDYIQRRPILGSPKPFKSIYTGFEFFFSDVAYSPNGNYLATLCLGQHNNNLLILDANTGNEVWRGQFESSIGFQPLECFSFSPDGNYLAYGGHHTGIIINRFFGYRVEVIAKIPFPMQPSCLSFTPDSRYLAWGNWGQDYPILITKIEQTNNPCPL